MSFDETATSGSHNPVVDLEANARIGRYRLQRPLGSGGMGVVWAAHDPDLDRDIALKVLRERGDSSRALLMREARAMAKLKHPNVLTVYEVGSANGRDFIAMELVDGDTLDAWFYSRPPRAEVIAALLAAGRGLEAAHKAGIVHRDFKPQNVLRARDGRVLVTDFGLARGLVDETPISVPPSASRDVVHAVEVGDTLALDRLTRTGLLVGTPAYMAPEQFGGAPPTVRTDLFAFCIAAWQGLTGSRPFKGATLEALATSAGEGVWHVEAELPRRLRAVLERGLDPEPDQRFPDVTSMLAAFEHAAAPRTRWLPIAAAGAGVLAIAGVAFALTRSSPETTLCDGATFPAVDDPVVETHWRARLDAACKLDAGARATQLACLADARDQVDADALVHRGRAADLPFDITFAPCSAAPPPLPADLAVQAAIRTVRLDAARLRRGSFDEARARDLVLRADRLDWRPIKLEVELAAGLAAQRLGHHEAARKFLTDAGMSALAIQDGRREAIARLALVQIAVVALANPADTEELPRIIRDTRDALDRDGNDPVLAAVLATANGEVELGQGRLDSAINRLDEARANLVAAGETNLARDAAWLEIEGLLDRNHGGDLDRAAKIAPAGPPSADAERAVHARWLALELARRRGDRAAIRAAAGKLAELVDPDIFDRGEVEVAMLAELGTSLTGPVKSSGSRSGRVVDDHGVPVAGARVVAFIDELGGDAHETDAVAGGTAVATTDASGTFALPAAPFVIAEHAGARSPAIAFVDSATLALTAPHTRSGRIAFDGDHPASLAVRAEQILARAGQIQHPSAGWVEHAAVDDAGAYRLDNLPDTALRVVATARAGRDATRLVELGDTPTWIDDTVYDIVIHSASRPERVWMIDEVGDKPLGAADLYYMTDAARDRVVAYPSPVGARDVTPVGRKLYKPGDYHAVFRGPHNPAEVCIETELQFSCGMLWRTEVDEDVVAWEIEL